MKHTQTYHVSGMHCASCAAIITKKIKKIPGVESCEVNPATEQATIQGESAALKTETFNEVLQPLGYSMHDHTTQEHLHMNHDEGQEDHSQHLGLNQSKTEKLQELAALASKVTFAMPLALLIFFFMMWDLLSIAISSVPRMPFPMEWWNFINFLLASIFMNWLGRPYLTAVQRFAQTRVANMDSLIGIGTGVAFLYSSIVFLFPALAALLQLPTSLYFDVTLVVLGFVTFGKYLEVRSKLKTGKALEKLMELQATTALLVDGKSVKEIPLSQVKVGDILLVKSGAKIPTDGVVVEGHSWVNESLMTGEPLPQEKGEKDAVIGGTLNSKGTLSIRATKVGQETLLSQIISLVESAQNSRANIQKLADQISAVFIPAVLAIALLTFVTWMTVGVYFLGLTQAFSFALLSTVGILIIACPCALGLATPIAIVVAVGKGAEQGILIKNAESLEKLSKVKTIFFDKTGTLTHGKPVVTDIISLDTKYSEKTLLQLAASLEKNSQHPLANAIVEHADLKKIESLAVKNFREEEGRGVSGVLKEMSIKVRKPQNSELNDTAVKNLTDEAKTVVIVEADKKVIGLLALRDTLHESTPATLKQLHQKGIKTVLLTGDNEQSARAVTKDLMIDEIHANLLPQEKLAILQREQEKQQLVAFVGDGINDAPALAQSDVGIALASGTDIAREAADITLLRGNIASVPEAFELSHLTLRTIKQNLFWAFLYNVLGIPLAAGVLYPIWGITLNPVFAGMAMGLSSVSVVLNALKMQRTKLTQK